MISTIGFLNHFKVAISMKGSPYIHVWLWKSPSDISGTPRLTYNYIIVVTP